MPLKHKVRLSRPVISLSIYLHTSHTEMLPEALQEAMLKKVISKYPIHSYLESSLRPLAGNFSLHIIQVRLSNFALQ